MRKTDKYSVYFIPKDNEENHSQNVQLIDGDIKVYDWHIL